MISGLLRVGDGYTGREMGQGPARSDGKEHKKVGLKHTNGI
jgi:hypothetical protein